MAGKQSLAIYLYVLAVLLLIGRLATGEEARAVPDAAWDAAFTRASGWTGGDVAGTVDLGGGRTLWVFGDSWIGPVVDGKHQAGSKMVNNAIAVSTSADAARPPAAADLRFYWGGMAAEPAAWVTPDVKRVPPRGITPVENGAAEAKTWYWASGGGAVLPTDAGGRRLVVFLFHVARNAKPKSGVWNFRTVGNAMAIVDNFADDPERWRIVQHDIPHCIVPGDGKGGDVKSDGAKNSERATNWGLAAYVDADAKPPLAYIYGTRAKPFDGELLLARVPAAAIEKADRWEFFTGESWSPDASRATAVADRIPSEFSVEKMKVAGEDRFVLVHSEVALGKRIFLRTAPRPEGPWPEARTVYTVPDVARHKSYFTYAAKGHAHLSRPGEVLVTYLVNGTDFGAMFRDAYIYRPRFVRVPLE